MGYYYGDAALLLSSVQEKKGPGQGKRCMCAEEWTNETKYYVSLESPFKDLYSCSNYL